MKLSEHFDSKEFTCKCGCGFDSVSIELINLLEEVRDYFEQPILVKSGCRCAEHNKKEGGAPNSQHLYGTAADIVVNNISPEVIYKFLDDKYPDKYGLGLYKKYKRLIHIDVRENRTRWHK